MPRFHRYYWFPFCGFFGGSGYNFIYLFLAVLSLCCCMDFFLVTANGDYSLVMVYRLLIMVASLIVRLQALGHVGFSMCSSQALEHRLNSCGSQA